MIGGRLLVLIVVAAMQTGCYYMQAARGQYDVLKRREPVAEVVADPATPAELARRLDLLQEARQFSIDELGLPDNNSYRSYSDLERDYVLWNVFAAPEFSLDSKRWCYPIVGCVSYRGYFSEDRAEREAAKLAARGFDVAVGGVPAYSTLGRFDDPILNTMLRWDDVHLVSTLFHELAHQVLYIKDDTAFNESFATAVEEIGIQRWLAGRGEKGDMSRYRERKAFNRDLLAIVDVARADLESLYASDVDDDTMRAAKAERMAALDSDVRALLAATGRQRHWLTLGLNNARLVPMALYEGHVPAFRALYAECEFDLECFYAAAIEVSELSTEGRAARLDALRSSDGQLP